MILYACISIPGLRIVRYVLLLGRLPVTQPVVLPWRGPNEVVRTSPEQPESSGDLHASSVGACSAVHLSGVCISRYCTSRFCWHLRKAPHAIMSCALRHLFVLDTG